ncbi:hypothetical protein [Stenotrophomonas sp. SY1]|uniref:hypothetical protein n=1 Tax=Stenotrophomonas sp. SY1 TaxID=477235 RepID=UPI001E50BCC3|nr:hypothetical protein [Stenotrophomonas sp. SY1]MCD9088079.1 hypothetical protein [Stenotrophomonas sp. SY1]
MKRKRAVKKKRPSRQDAAAGRGRDNARHAVAVRLVSQAVCFCLAVSVVNMVSDEIEAGNEKPRTGVGAGSFIESGCFSVTRQFAPHLLAR